MFKVTLWVCFKNEAKSRHWQAVLSAKSITGGYAGIDRRPCINSEGGHIVLLKLLNLQGTESSDLSLISDFFPPPRTILGISVNLKRNFFGGRWGYGYWGKMTPKALECTICGPRIQKFSGGGPPDPPTRNHILQIPVTMCGIPHRAWHYAKDLRPVTVPIRVYSKVKIFTLVESQDK